MAKRSLSKSAARDCVRPLKNHKLYLIFAELDGSPGACLKFAETLTRMPQVGAAEPLKLWPHSSEQLTQAVPG